MRLAGCGYYSESAAPKSSAREVTLDAGILAVNLAMLSHAVVNVPSIDKSPFGGISVKQKKRRQAAGAHAGGIDATSPAPYSVRVGSTTNGRSRSLRTHFAKPPVATSRKSVLKFFLSSATISRTIPR